MGITVDGSGNLYVCNCSGNFIAKVDTDGRTTRFAESPDFDCPNGITFDPSGDFIVASFGNGYLVRVSPDGEAETWVEVPEGRNAHVAATAHGLYVAKIESNRIYRIDRAGTIEAFAGTGELGLDERARTRSDARASERHCRVTRWASALRQQPRRPVARLRPYEHHPASHRASLVRRHETLELLEPVEDDVKLTACPYS